MLWGTAGHIDHGKTSLVKALTGIDTDRLPEEKRRGITLELGFAHLALEDGTTVGVVDVPGHERFVKAMAAGAGGLDAALLVIALDAGVMPQTREHLDICGLLGVQKGVIVLTKADLAPELGEEWGSLIEADVAGLVKGTFLEGAPVLRCSAKTGQGLDALRSALCRVSAAVRGRLPEGPLFLPLDRSFTVKGFGTVVTGSLLSGSLAPGEEVVVLPRRLEAVRVRSVQVHGKPVSGAQAGQRVAVNLPGVAAADLPRGSVLGRAGELAPTSMLDVSLHLLATAPAPLPRRTRLLLHAGTAQVDVTVALLDVDALAPGGTALAQLRLGQPLGALPGQRFILRGFQVQPGRGATLAGGVVLSTVQARRRKGAAAQLAPLLAPDPEPKVAWVLEQAGYAGATQRELFARTALPPRTLQRALEVLGTRGALVLTDRERRHFVAASVAQRLRGRILSLLDAFHAREPLREGMAREELRQRLAEGLDARVLQSALGPLLAAGTVAVFGDLLCLPGRSGTRSLSGADASTRDALLRELERAGLSPPRVEELAAKLSLEVRKAVALLQGAVAEGRVQRVTEALYFDARALAALEQRLVTHLQAEREITTQAFKDLVGQTRKYVIPLSEFFDRQKVTLRVGDKRVLRRAPG